MTRLLHSVRAGLRVLRRRAWRDECPAGGPVPDATGCDVVACGVVSLAALGVGDGGTISCLEDPGSPRTARLVALGLVPGVRLRLLQRYPAFVIRVGRAELALDGELAGRIRVR
ncbi:MAG: ferrous iron transport protein A, partial [Gemmatimonadetes bacterium]|nr:ferrous iron transport protein A [Gemmatimonadota bacterium]